MKHLASLALLFGFAVCPACLWDYDTLSMEAKGMPEVLDAIVGRFERNPPLYYEMRLERVTKQIRGGSSQLSLFDDAAVACDRLGRGDEGLARLNKKRVLLENADPAVKTLREDWYRYYANVGTLRVHKWFKEGASDNRLVELQSAISEIEQAIKINPDAHFGRERVQLGLMRAVYAYRTKGQEEAHDAIYDLFNGVHGPPQENLREGLVGLITLGAAWESQDVIALLRSNRLMIMDRNIQTIADFRIEEIKKLGGVSVFGEHATNILDSMHFGNSSGQSKEELARAYRALRENADAFHKHRENFMLARLKQGRHPDTDKSFWDGYKETPRIELRQFEPLIPRKWYASPTAGFWIFLSFVSALVVSIFVIKKRRAAPRSTPPPLS